MRYIDTQTSTIYVTRGESIPLPFKIKNYTFKEGDIIEFKIYGELALNEEPLLVIKEEVKEPTDIVYINLTSDDTIRFPLANKEITYWYEIDLNIKNVVLGFDMKKAKKLILYPKGKEMKEVENNE